MISGLIKVSASLISLQRSWLLWISQKPHAINALITFGLHACNISTNDVNCAESQRGFCMIWKLCSSWRVPPAKVNNTPSSNCINSPDHTYPYLIIAKDDKTRRAAIKDEFLMKNYIPDSLNWTQILYFLTEYPK